MLVLNENDISNIEDAKLQPGRLWDNSNLQYLRDKIRNHFIDVEVPKCCYCWKSFRGQHRLEIDTEHILPQSIYTDLVYKPENLNIACKRCNMGVKRENVEFITDQSTMGTDYFISQHYKLIHPNLDIYVHHIVRKEITEGNFVFLKFIVKNNSDKGKYTYNFFRLEELEIDNINIAQGINPLRNFSSFVNLHRLRIRTKI